MTRDRSRVNRRSFGTPRWIHAPARARPDPEGGPAPALDDRRPGRDDSRPGRDDPGRAPRTAVSREVRGCRNRHWRKDAHDAADAGCRAGRRGLRRRSRTVPGRGCGGLRSRRGRARGSHAHLRRVHALLADVALAVPAGHAGERDDGGRLVLRGERAGHPGTRRDASGCAGPLRAGRCGRPRDSAGSTRCAGGCPRHCRAGRGRSGLRADRGGCDCVRTRARSDPRRYDRAAAHGLESALAGRRRVPGQHGARRRVGSAFPELRGVGGAPARSGTWRRSAGRGRRIDRPWSVHRLHRAQNRRRSRRAGLQKT